MIAAALEGDAVKGWRWLGHTVKVIDGTTLSLADTAANQARWPQSQSQKPGCGFPTMRLVGIFSLATGALLARAIGPLAVGERVLFTEGLLRTLAKRDIVLQDRGLSGYGMAALLLTRGIHLVTRIQQRLSVSITTARRNAPTPRRSPSPPPSRHSVSSPKALEGDIGSSRHSSRPSPTVDSDAVPVGTNPVP